MQFGNAPQKRLIHSQHESSFVVVENTFLSDKREELLFQIIFLELDILIKLSLLFFFQNNFWL